MEQSSSADEKAALALVKKLQDKFGLNKFGLNDVDIKEALKGTALPNSFPSKWTDRVELSDE